MTVSQNDNLVQKIKNDPSIRRILMRESHYWFFHYYLAHYVIFPAAELHREMFALTEDDTKRLIVLMGFRDCSKSTIFTLSYPLWSIMGRQQKKFVLIASQTQRQARQQLANIRNELEANPQLRRDLGPFRDESDEWGTMSMVIPNYGARISAISPEQGMRGLRHLQHRPDLIVVDDVENSSSVRTKEGRDKIYRWLTGEILPAGSDKTKTAIIGNLLHQDALLMRLSREIATGQRSGSFHAYPIINENGETAWPGKFPNMAAIEEKRKSVGNEAAWQREYMLHLVPEEDCIVQEDWIQYYDELPSVKRQGFREIVMGLDPALSKSATADYTAVVTAQVYGYGKDLNIFVLPNPINKRLTNLETLDQVELLYRQTTARAKATVVSESVGYQGSIVEQLKTRSVHTIEFKPGTHDKATRLNAVSHLFQGKQIFFPRHGAEQLIRQVVDFGIERHDDLMDALVMVITHANVRKPVTPEVFVVRY